MEKLEQARSEFVRLKNELIENGENTMFEQGRISAFEDAILFIDSLQNLPVPKFKVGDKVRKKGGELVATINSVTETAYLCDIYDDLGDYDDDYAFLISEQNSWELAGVFSSEEPGGRLCSLEDYASDLLNECDAYVDPPHVGMPRRMEQVWRRESMIKALECGARWKMQQMMKDALKGTVYTVWIEPYHPKNHRGISIKNVPDSLKDGQKVKLIVIKEGRYEK